MFILTLRMSLFGVMRVSHGAGPIEEKMHQAVKGLLAYLVLFRRIHTREVLFDLFWGDYSEGRARKCLNTALWRLRKVLEPTGVPRGTYLITTATGKVGFNCQSNYRLDVAEFEKQTQKALAKSYNALTDGEAHSLENALKLYTGDLLEGFYDDWALRERERYFSLHLKGLAHLLKYHRHRKDYEKAISCGQKILDLDPLREEIHREMMRLHAANRQRPQAIRQYETCCRILDEDLSVGPMEETRLLHDQICNQSKRELSHSNPLFSPNAVRQTLHQAQKALREFDKVSEHLRRMTRRLEQFMG
jgi:DNA-binding SARP family transcriptional activator